MKNNNFLIFLALLQKDLKVSLASLKSIIIDTVIQLSIFVLLFAYFLPSLGMNKKLSAPLFLGSFLMTIISLSYSRMVRIKSDIEFKRFIDYHFILPISRKWLIAEYICAYICDITISTFVALLVGLIFIDNTIIFKINLFYFCLIYFSSLLFFSISFLFMAFRFPWIWLLNNTWERIINPLTQLGCIFYIWYQLDEFSPNLGKLTLLNPLTYVVEGLRYSISGNNNFLPIAISLLVLLTCSFLMTILLMKAIKKKIDPV